MRRFVLGLALIASLLLAACASPTASPAPTDEEDVAAGLSGSISITGSTTVQPWQKNWLKISWQRTPMSKLK